MKDQPGKLGRKDVIQYNVTGLKTVPGSRGDSELVTPVDVRLTALTHKLVVYGVSCKCTDSYTDWIQNIIIINLSDWYWLKF